jgi:hypothetical protein
MNTKQLITLAALAFAGTAALADDITIVNDNFSPLRSRAEVRADVLKARAGGVQAFTTEAQAQPGSNANATPSTLSREQVRAEVRNSPRAKFMIYNPAA